MVFSWMLVPLPQSHRIVRRAGALILRIHACAAERWAAVWRTTLASRRRRYYLAPDWFEGLNEFGQGFGEQSLLCDVKTCKRVADIQACPDLVPRLRLQALAKCGSTGLLIADASGNTVYFGIVFSRADETSEYAAELYVSASPGQVMPECRP